ncbi:MAG: hypothetical protein ACFCD0_23550 [Gemmataceae bacterium]
MDPLVRLALVLVSVLLVTALVCYVVRRFGGPLTMVRLVPLLVALVFAIVYTILPFAEWFPDPKRRESWMWLPYQLLTSGLAGFLEKPQSEERSSWHLMAMSLLTLLLIPLYPAIEPIRHIHIGCLAGGVLLLGGPLVSLARKSQGGLLPGILGATSFGVTLIAFLAGSAKYAEVNVSMAGALLGVGLAISAFREESWLANTIPMVASSIVGMLYLSYVGQVTPVVPLDCYLLIGAGPLVLLVFAEGPFAKFEGWSKRILWTVSVATPVLIGVFRGAWLAGYLSPE